MDRGGGRAGGEFCSIYIIKRVEQARVRRPPSATRTLVPPVALLRAAVSNHPKFALRALLELLLLRKRLKGLVRRLL